MRMGCTPRVPFILPFALLLVSAGAVHGNPQAHGEEREPRREARVIREGIAVEFSLAPVAGRKKKSQEVREGEDVVVQFRITDATTGSPATGLRPAAWMDAPTGGQRTEADACRQKVQSFLQGSLRSRPEIDLNTYYVLALNREPNISVIDPLLGFGTSKLLALIPLKSPGEDWVLTRDGKRLFVSMPLVNQVAVVDTTTWKVVANIDAGFRPTRLSLQPDGKYLWVANDAEGRTGGKGGVTVIDTGELKVAARIRTGAGPHEVALTDDDRYAFVTNSRDGTLSVIDVQALAKVKDISIGPLPAALAFSPLSQAVYVVLEGEGTIVVVDARDHTVVTRIGARPGLRAIRFVPDGRWGFVLNGKDHVAQILDASTNRLLHTVEVGKGPDQVSFTRYYAYIRSTASEAISMIALSGLGQEGAVPVFRFSAGQKPPDASSPIGVAPVLFPAPEGNAVLVANPADKIIYYYTEGMAAPMGSFQNYRREPRGVLVVDRSLRETAPGMYATTVRLTRSGNYDVAFLLEAPRILHCFALSVDPNPAIKGKGKRVAVQVELLLQEREIPVGENVRLRFRLTDPSTNQPRVGLKDVGVLALLAPGTWQKRAWAQSGGDGIYEVTVAVPRSGVYYLFVQVPSLQVRFNDLPPLILQATGEKPPSAVSTSERTRGEPR
jgi:YVTN family beta-propeller protein